MMEPKSRAEMGFALLRAAEEGNLEQVRALVSADNVNWKEKISVQWANNELTKNISVTPLYHAIAGGHSEVVKFLLEAGASTSEACHKPILNVACRKGTTAVVKVLLDHGATVESVELLVEVCGRYDADVEMLRLILGAGAALDIMAMSCAALLDHFDIVQTLLAAGHDVNALDSDGMGPLHSACTNRSADGELVRVLLGAGAAVDAKNNLGVTPLMLTTTSNNLTLLKILISVGADVNAVDSAHYTALHYAVEKTSIDFVRTLLEHGANISALNEHKATPIQPAIKKIDGGFQIPFIAALSLLLDYGAGDGLCQNTDCKCGKSLMLCAFRFHRNVIGAHFREVCPGSAYGRVSVIFQMHSIKIRAAATGRENIDFTRPLADFDMSIAEKQAYLEACEDELMRMRTEKVGDSNVMYKHIWHRRPAAVRQVSSLPIEDCLAKFPIYGEILRRRYVVELKKLPLLDQSMSFFLLTDLPRLPVECADEILSYLPEQDLLQMVAICEAYWREKTSQV